MSIRQPTMKFAITSLLGLTLCQSWVSAIPQPSKIQSRQTASCAGTPSGTNTPDNRRCWGPDFSIDTDWYDVTPVTQYTADNPREFWLNVENVNLAPDGYLRPVLAYNGSIPGPPIIADWGDHIAVHVTNKLTLGQSGTTVHWHGIRQGNNSEYDGVPGVTQCPLNSTDSMTYRFQATQYGSTWYHSHIIMQYGDGLQGSLIINGPATADYDHDLGMIHLTDWNHAKTAQQLWETIHTVGGAPPQMDTGLINGTNTYDCTSINDPNCIGGGKKFEATFVPGDKHRIRLVNGAVDGHFEFSIDGHQLQVIANDLVPIVPYFTNKLVISMGQRYDVIVQANQTAKDYWLRGGWNTCQGNKNAANITGIIRYDSTSTADPTTSPLALTNSCVDEPRASLVPHLSMDVAPVQSSATTFEDVTLGGGVWLLNGTTLNLTWSDPTTLRIFKGEQIFPAGFNVVAINTTDDIWEVLVIQDELGLNHPIHLHGHDFWVLDQQANKKWASNPTIPSANLSNAPRRDVATLMAGGYLALAFKKDNPGSWLVHCHIAWHASQGLAMQFVERESEIAATISPADAAAFNQTCANWKGETQDDSGI